MTSGQAFCGSPDRREIMRRIDAYKIGLALCAVALFSWSLRTDSEQFRWAAIACLVAAFLIRFIRPRA
jgi:hypothetical protein